MQANSPRLARRLLALLIFSVLVGIARGGEFLLPLASGHRWPTGGAAANSSNQNNPYPPSNYYMDSDGWYGGVSNTVQNDKCSGEITYSWAWSGTGSDVAPTKVVLKIEARAEWISPPGACSAGLTPSAPVTPTYAGPTVIGGSASGVRYVVKDVVGGTVEYKITPPPAPPGATATSPFG